MIKQASIFLLAAMFSVPVLATDAASLKTDKDKLSYTMGVQIGKNFKNTQIDVNVDAFINGLKDVLTNQKSALTDEQMQTAMQQLRQMAIKQRAAQMEQAKKAGEKFLADNKKKKGVVTLPSGVQYKIIRAGTGKKPKLTDKITADYEGRLIDGKIFDSSYKRGEPATFPVNGVIKGWQEVLQLMKVGAKWEVYIPAELAYGERGAGRSIGPNEALVFDIELRKIN